MTVPPDDSSRFSRNAPLLAATVAFAVGLYAGHYYSKRRYPMAVIIAEREDALIGWE